MNHKYKSLKVGDKVAFGIEGSDIDPWGYGVVTRVSAMGVLILPDRPNLDRRIRMTNIRKVEVKNG